jgi:hypothetical protein
MTRTARASGASRLEPPLRWSAGMACPDDHIIVMFGATGDLAKRKLLPGLFHLATSDLRPEQYDHRHGARGLR